jgi:hypothetical protein
VIDFLGGIIFLVIITIGSLDGRSGLGVFGMYRSASMFDMPGRTSTTQRRWGAGGQSTPPAPVG